MIVVVSGGRTFTDSVLSDIWLNRIRSNYGISLVIEGGAAGADTLAREWATRNNVPCKTIFADWKTNGLSAGPIRNREMLKDHSPDFVLTFPHAQLSGEGGTADMIAAAMEQGYSLVVAQSITTGRFKGKTVKLYHKAKDANQVQRVGTASARV